MWHEYILWCRVLLEVAYPEVIHTYQWIEYIKHYGFKKIFFGLVQILPRVSLIGSSKSTTYWRPFEPGPKRFAYGNQVLMGEGGGLGVLNMLLKILVLLAKVRLFLVVWVLILLVWVRHVWLNKILGRFFMVLILLVLLRWSQVIWKIILWVVLVLLWYILTLHVIGGGGLNFHSNRGDGWIRLGD
jgi:hypothetical protein